MITLTERNSAVNLIDTFYIFIAMKNIILISDIKLGNCM